MKHAPVLIAALFLFVFARPVPAQNTGVGTLQIQFQPQFAGQPLVLEKEWYRLPGGDSLTIDVLRFYLSSFELQGEKTAFAEKDSYHLIDAEDSATQIVVLKNIPVGEYSTLHFNIGTDSLTNVSGAMGGDLDPTLGMYWAWNTGYINFKIEGRSNVCNTLHHTFEFHVGGYMPPYPTVRPVVLPVLKNVIIAENKRTVVAIQVDLAQFFQHISLQSTNQVMIPGKIAVAMADHFQGIFKINQ